MAYWYLIIKLIIFIGIFANFIFKLMWWFHPLRIKLMMVLHSLAKNLWPISSSFKTNLFSCQLNEWLSTKPYPIIYFSTSTKIVFCSLLIQEFPQVEVESKRTLKVVFILFQMCLADEIDSHQMFSLLLTIYTLC